MALKFAVEAEAPGARVWLDQDQRDKSLQGASPAARWIGSHRIPRGPTAWLPLRGFVI